MSDEMQHQDFGSTEALLIFIKEKSDDIEKAVIPQTKEMTFHKAGAPSAEFWYLGMILELVDGGMKLIGRKDATAVLNDGILNRMRIPIEFVPDPNNSDGSFMRFR